MQIKLQNLGAFAPHALFKNLTMSIGTGDRLGVVGNNGCGKTTLLRTISGLIEAGAGSVTRPRGSRLLFVQQSIPSALLNCSLRQSVLEGLRPEERHTSAWRAELALDMFEAPEEMRDREVSRLSGGWARLALIARAWIADPDALVIDEPTNHLDLSKILLLESWLNTQLGDTPLVVASHDRRFLDSCTNRTLFLRPSESRIYSHPFSAARKALSDDDRALENRKERETVELQRLQKSAHHLRQIGVNNYSAAALRKSIQIQKRADAAEAALPEVYSEPQRDIRLSTRDSHAKVALSIRDLTITRPDGVALFSIHKLDIMRGQRLVLMGRNGTGKTHFVKRLREAVTLPEHSISEALYIAPSIVMGYIDQAMTQLPSEPTLQMHVSEALGSGIQSTISTLITAGFPLPEQTKRIQDVSPGQRARLGLLLLRLCVPNLYLMDEPTNHIDIAGQEQLEAQLATQDATAIIVSHDRTFVKNTGTRFLVVEQEHLWEIDEPDVFYDALASGVQITSLLNRPLAV